MEAKAVAKYMKFSPQKARLIVDQIRGKKADEALTILSFTRKAASKDIIKVVKSALANAENTKKLDVDKLYIRRAYVDSGPSTKRLQAKAMGKGAMIIKRSCHVTIVVGEGKSKRA